MNARLVLCVCIAAACASAIVVAEPASQPAEKKVSFTEKQITFEYPASWSKLPEQQGIPIQLSVTLPGKARMFSTFQLQADPANSLKEMTEGLIQGWRQAEPTAKVLSQKSTKIGGEAATQIDMSQSLDPQTEGRVRLIAIVHGKTGYVFEIITEKDAFDGTASLLDDVLKSVKWQK